MKTEGERERESRVGKKRLREKRRKREGERLFDICTLAGGFCGGVRA